MYFPSGDELSDDSPGYDGPPTGFCGPRPPNAGFARRAVVHIEQSTDAPRAQITVPPGLERRGGWFNTRTLYHCTNRVAARAIQLEGFHPGTSGMFGPGIYFAPTASAARRKATRDPSVVITARVWLGFMLECPSAMNHLTADDVYAYGCHSIHGQTRNTGDEFVVFDSANVVRMTDFHGL
jgi:hypothetical protein